MATKIQLTIEVDDEYADPEHPSGLTEAGFEALSDAIVSIGTIADGPDKVD